MQRSLWVLAVLGLLIGCEDSNNDGGTISPVDGGTFDSGGGNQVDGGPNLDDAGSDGATDGGTNNVAAFTLRLGFTQSCALFADGSVKCWGQVYAGNSGAKLYGNAPNTMGANLPALDFGAGVKVKELSVNRNTACALLDGGVIKCFGVNNSDALGYEGSGFLTAATKSVDLGAGHTAKKVSVTGDHGCAVLDDDSVKCWGNLLYLGQGVTTGLTTVAVPIDLGAGHTAKNVFAELMFTCAILDDDRVKCWGANGNGAGDQSTAGGNLCTGDLFARGNDPGEMGDALAEIDLGIDPATTNPWKVKSLYTGDLTVCALLANDRIKCWGRNDGGSEGTGNVTSYGSTSALVGDAIPFLDLGTDPGTGQPWKVKSFDRGDGGSCAVLANDRIKCWGTNEYGTLGLQAGKGIGPLMNIGDTAAEMGDALPFVDLGTDPATGQPWVVNEIAVGSYQACARIGGDKLKCWGYGANGMLGLGDGNDRGTMPNQMGDTLPLVQLK